MVLKYLWQNSFACSDKKAFFFSFSFLSQQAARHSHTVIGSAGGGLLWGRAGLSAGRLAWLAEPSCVQAGLVQRNTVGGRAAGGLELPGEPHVASAREQRERKGTLTKQSKTAYPPCFS